MPKFLNRIVALFLVPCLASDPALAANLHFNSSFARQAPSQLSVNQEHLFEEQALEPVVLWMHRALENVRSASRVRAMAGVAFAFRLFHDSGLKAGRVAAFALFVSLATLGVWRPAFAEALRSPPAAGETTPQDIASLLHPLTPEHYALFQASPHWGRYFSHVSYPEYLREYESLARERALLKETLERWRTMGGTYGEQIWQMLNEHPHPIVISHHLPEDFAGALEPPLGILLLDAKLFSEHSTPEERNRMEYMLAYYLGHELLHEVYPQESETQVHARSTDLVMPIAAYDGWNYSRMRYIVQRALNGDSNAADILAFKLEGDALEEARRHTLGVIDPVIAAVEEQTGIPPSRIVYEDVLPLPEEDIAARDAELERTGQRFNRMSTIGFYVQAEANYYWVWLGDGRFQVLLDPLDHIHYGPDPLIDAPRPGPTDTFPRLVSKSISEGIETLGALRRTLEWLLQAYPRARDTVSSRVEEIAQQKGWRDETLLTFILRKDIADHWTIEKLEPVELEVQMKSSVRPEKSSLKKGLQRGKKLSWKRMEDISRSPRPFGDIGLGIILMNPFRRRRSTDRKRTARFGAAA